MLRTAVMGYNLTEIISSLEKMRITYILILWIVDFVGLKLWIFFTFKSGDVMFSNMCVSVSFPTLILISVKV